MISLLVLIYMNGLITSNPIRSDAQQNLRMGYHLYKNGVISKDADVTGKPAPTNYREPVPPVVTAIFMYLHPGIEKTDSLSSFENGVNTKRVKQVNLIWLFLLQIGVGLLAFRVSRNKVVPFLAWFLVFFYFIRFGNHFDEMNTELASAVLIIWSSYLLLVTLSRKSIIYFTITGLLLGLLILTKAVFYYVAPVVILALLVYKFRTVRFLNYAALAGAIVLVVFPWMVRNYTIYEEFSITQRGGSVLYQRAMLNQLNGEEVVGAVYHWGPQLYRSVVNLTPFEIDSADFKPGGPYQRLLRDQIGDSIAIDRGRPDQAISLFGKTRAEINRLQNVLGNEEQEGPRHEAFDIMQAEGMDMILSSPVKHGAMSLLFLWRGVWALPNATIPVINDPLQSIIHNLINLAAYLSIFIFLGYGFFRKKDGLLILSIIPAFMILFQAAVSPSLSRFNEPAIPSMLVAFALMMHFIHLRVLVHYPAFNPFSKWRRRGSN